MTTTQKWLDNATKTKPTQEWLFETGRWLDVFLQSKDVSSLVLSFCGLSVWDDKQRVLEKTTPCYGGFWYQNKQFYLIDFKPANRTLVQNELPALFSKADLTVELTSQHLSGNFHDMLLLDNQKEKLLRDTLNSLLKVKIKRMFVTKHFLFLINRRTIDRLNLVLPLSCLRRFFGTWLFEVKDEFGRVFIRPIYNSQKGVASSITF